MITGSRYRNAPAYIMIYDIYCSIINIFVDYILGKQFRPDCIPRINKDKFGISEVYSTANKGESWFFNSSRPIDGQFDPNKANITKYSDGSWHLHRGITRMLDFTKSS